MRGILPRGVFLLSNQHPSIYPLHALNSSTYRGAYELWAEAATKEELHDETRRNRYLWEGLGDQQSWKFDVTATNHTIPMERQKEVIEEFAYMDYQGPIDMKKASLVVTYFEECEATPFRIAKMF
jgi:hypothetical protein